MDEIQVSEILMGPGGFHTSPKAETPESFNNYKSQVPSLPHSPGTVSGLTGMADGLHIRSFKSFWGWGGGDYQIRQILVCKKASEGASANSTRVRIRVSQGAENISIQLCPPENLM